MSEKDTGEEELFSMEDLEKDLKKGRGARRVPWFLGGLVLGVAGTLALPPLLAPYLPEALRGSREVLSGPVLGEERDGERLLLTIDAEPGALIASFTERVAEIALLVEPGDIVTIAVPDYEPFVENPDFEGVKKGPGGNPRPEASTAESPAEAGADRPTADSAATEGTAPDTARADAAGPEGAAPPDTLPGGAPR